LKPSLSAVRLVAKSLNVAASIRESRRGEWTRTVAIEGFWQSSVSHETTSPAGGYAAKPPLAIAGPFLLKPDADEGLKKICPAKALKLVPE